MKRPIIKIGSWPDLYMIVSSNKENKKVKSLSRVRLFATLWTVAHQAPLSMGFSRQEYWSGLPFPSPGDLPDPGIKPRSPALQADALLRRRYIDVHQRHVPQCQGNTPHNSQNLTRLRHPPAERIRTSPVAQWVRIHPPIQGTRV